MAPPMVGKMPMMAGMMATVTRGSRKIPCRAVTDRASSPISFMMPLKIKIRSRLAVNCRVSGSKAPRKEHSPILYGGRLNKKPKTTALLRRLMLRAIRKRMNSKMATKMKIIFRKSGILFFF